MEELDQEMSLNQPEVSYSCRFFPMDTIHKHPSQMVRYIPKTNPRRLVPQ